MPAEKLHTGPVAFVDGVHYPLDKNDQPDLERPLRWTPDGYRAAEDGEPLHNDAHHMQDVALPVGDEG